MVESWQRHWQAQRAAQRPCLLHLCGYKLIHLPHLFLVVQVNVPGVKVHRLVLEGLENVAPRARGQHLAPVTLVKEGDKLALRR